MALGEGKLAKEQLHLAIKLKPQMCTEHLLCAKHYSRLRRQQGTKGEIPAFMELPGLTTTWFLSGTVCSLRQLDPQSGGFLPTLRTWHFLGNLLCTVKEGCTHVGAHHIQLQRQPALVLEICAQSLKKILTLANWKRNKLTEVDNTF